MSLPQWLVLKASAGSGKTYALVFHYLRLSLSVGSNESYYRHILAITFTNAAAAEMKHRVITTLYALTRNEAGKESQLFQDLCKDLRIDGDELRLRAEATFNHMIHHYGQISIGTIDGFNHRLLRSFAFDLHLQQDFKVETEQIEFKRDLLQELFSEVGKDEMITRYFLSFVFDKMEDEKNWDITSSLAKIANLLFDEEAQKHLPLLADLTLQDFRETEKILRDIIARFETNLKKSVEAAARLIEENELSITDFAYGNQGGLGKYILKIYGGSRELPSRANILDKLDSGKIVGGKVSTEKKQIIESSTDVFAKAVHESVEILLGKDCFKATLAELILRTINELGLLQRMGHISEELRRKKNLVFVSDFQKVIHGVVAENPAPFIYEKIGERYHHILFDEFQDTSEMQWNNLLPLLENALSKNQFNLIVGDGKQAIYRWRNGKAEQFTRLPDLGPGHEENQVLFTAAYRSEVLPNNYRSARKIIQFNNKFYEHLSHLNARAEATYADLIQQEVKDEEGYVKIQFYKKPKKSSKETDEENDDELEYIEGNYISEVVQNCLNDGYRYQDIAILTRMRGKDAGPIQEVLHQLNIPVLTQESLLLSESAPVMATVSFLKFLVNPQSNADAIRLLRILHTFHPDKIKDKDHWLFAGKKVKQSLFTFLGERFGQSAVELAEVLPLYESAEKFVKLLSIPFDDSLEILLDQLHQLESKKSLHLSAFTEWWDEKGSKLYQPGSGKRNAVRIMTIHASKGLQFPVVIVPVKNTKEHTKFLWVDTRDEEIPIPRVWIQKNESQFPGAIPEEFEVENELEVLDQLNLTYVATTRAESRLYIVCEEITFIGKNLLTFCNNADLFEKKEDAFETGLPQTPSFSHVEDEMDGSPISIPEFSTISTLLNQSRKQSGNIERSLNVYRSSKMGRELHETLSMFSHAETEARVLEKIKARWPLMNEILQKELVNQVMNIFQSEALGRWFQSGDTAFTEREIISSNGSIYRPDRIVLTKEEVGVIDFKTGKPLVSHADQVRQYMQEISAIYSLPVRGFVAYIPDLELTEVTMN